MPPRRNEEKENQRRKSNNRKSTSRSLDNTREEKSKSPKKKVKVTFEVEEVSSRRMSTSELTKTNFKGIEAVSTSENFSSSKASLKGPIF